MNKNVWNVNKLAELQYKQSLNKVYSAMLKYIPNYSDIETIKTSLQYLGSTPEFNELSTSIASRFATALNQNDIKLWQEVARMYQGGRMVDKLLKETLLTHVGTEIDRIVKENATLISNMPLDIAEKMSKYASNKTFEGLTYKQIANDLKKTFSDYSKSRINLIARTESSKASTALTEARSKDVGVGWYIWRTALDGKRVRDSHQIMEAVLCSWSEPPAPELLAGQESQGKYHAGGIYNCRCFPQPLVLVNQISWPAKVHMNGRIVTMSLEQFLKIGA